MILFGKIIWNKTVYNNKYIPADSIGIIIVLQYPRL